MLPISFFENKQYLSEVKTEFKFPPGTDLNQVDIRANKVFKESFSGLRASAKKVIIDKYKDLFCFYCGERTDNVELAFLHNYSGLNTWMFSDWRCSAVICETCNKYSGGERINYLKGFKKITPGAPKKLLSFHPDILIPSIEPVDKHFSINQNGYLNPITIRAESTIRRFGLNRIELVSKRQKTRSEVVPKSETLEALYWDHNFLYTENPLLWLFTKIADEEKRKLVHECYPFYADQYSSFFSKIRFRETAFLKLDGIDKKTYKNFRDFIGIDSIDLWGIRGFHDYVSLNLEGRTSVIILGENGVGKSTLLEVIKNLVAVNFRCNWQELAESESIKPSLKITYPDGGYFLVSHQRKEGQRNTANIVFIKEERLSNRKTEQLCNLLVERFKNESSFNQLTRQLRLLLDIEEEYKLVVEKGLVYWQNLNSPIEKKYFNQFSSGYKSLLNIFYEIVRRQREFSINHANPSIVFIEELELHLHPIFKKNIVHKLKSIFPGIIFFITTHDPLILNSASRDVSIVALVKENGKTKIRQNLPEHSEMKTEQLLTSPIFGMDTLTADESVNELFEKYYTVLNSSDKIEISKFRKKMSLAGHLGRNYREFVALAAVDTYLAANNIPVIDEVAKLLKKLDGLDEEN